MCVCSYIKRYHFGPRAFHRSFVPTLSDRSGCFFVLCCYSKSVSFSEKRSLSLFHLFSSTPRRERTKHAHSTTTATLTPMKNQSQCCVGACWFVRNEILMNITHTHTKKTDVQFKRRVQIVRVCEKAKARQATSTENFANGLYKASDSCGRAKRTGSRVFGKQSK